MTFEELMAATPNAHPGSPVRVRTADGAELDVVDVDIPLTNLDEGKLLGDVVEGFGRDNPTVWLIVG